MLFGPCNAEDLRAMGKVGKPVWQAPFFGVPWGALLLYSFESIQKKGRIAPAIRKNPMKHTTKLLCALLCVLLLFPLAACGKTDTDTLWQSAAYTEDTALGEGARTVKLTVTAGEKSVLLTVKTDKENLGEALLELGLIAGDAGEYGLYVKKVNGITADYDTDQSYWGFYTNGEMAMTGVDGETIDENTDYALVYTK